MQLYVGGRVRNMYGKAVQVRAACKIAGSCGGGHGGTGSAGEGRRHRPTRGKLSIAGPDKLVRHHAEGMGATRSHVRRETGVPAAMLSLG